MFHLRNGLVAKVMACDLEASEFELQLHYHAHFRTNNLVKSMTPLIPASHQLDSTNALLQQQLLLH